MNKKFKKALTAIAALTLGITAVCGMGACTYHKKALQGDYSTGEVTSQGGWAVRKGNYVYYINGQPEGDSDDDGNVTYENNKYGKVVKGSLCRVKITNGVVDYDNPEIVVPLIVTGENYSSGIFIYGDYVYYATPTTTKNLQGSEESGYLDFKRSKLDGTETMKGYYFRSSDATADYRFVEVNGIVYCLHVDDSDLYSYKIKGEKGEDTLLVKDAASYLFDSYDLANPYIYYTMSVTKDIDKKNPISQTYNQVYRVRADASYQWDETGTYTVTGYFDDYTDKQAATAAETYSYTYSFDWEYLKEEADDNDEDFYKNDISYYPYVNLGQAVLDGIGSGDEATQYNQNGKTGATEPIGYTYTLNTYANNGIYYTREYNQTTSASGDVGKMYYLADKNVTSDPIANNKNNDLIAKEGGNASSAGYFYIDEKGHHYFYTKNSALVRVDIDQDGEETETTIDRNVSVGAYLQFDQENNTLYYTTGSDSLSVYRTQETDTKNDYNSFVDDENRTVEIFRSVAHVSGWYQPEIIDGNIFYVEGSTVGSLTLTTPRVVAFGNMTNQEIADIDDTIDDVKDLYDDVSSNLSSAYTVIDYFRKTDGGIKSTKYTLKKATDYSDDGMIDLYDEVIQYSVEDGNTSTKIYAPEVQKCIIAYLKGEDYKYSNTVTFEFSKFKADGEFKNFKNYGDFYHKIGIDDDDDDVVEALNDEWRISVLSGEEYDDSLPTWAWVLIWVGVGIAVIGITCAITIPLMRRHAKKNDAETEETPVRRKKKVVVDMDVDKDLDVYATDPVEPETKESAEDEDTAEVVEETATETEEATEEVTEATEVVAEPAETPVAEPAEKAETAETTEKAETAEKTEEVETTEDTKEE